MKEGYFDDMAIEEPRLIASDRILGMVETTHQAPEECHRTVRAANSAAPCRPIRCLDVFHSIDSVGPQQWKKELKRRNDVLVEVAPIIDDDIEPAIFGRQSCVAESL